MSNIIENNFVSYLFNFISQYFWTYSYIIFEYIQILFLNMFDKVIEP